MTILAFTEISALAAVLISFIGIDLILIRRVIFWNCINGCVHLQ